MIRILNYIRVLAPFYLIIKKNLYIVLLSSCYCDNRVRKYLLDSNLLYQKKNVYHKKEVREKEESYTTFNEKDHDWVCCKRHFLDDDDDIDPIRLPFHSNADYRVKPLSFHITKGCSLKVRIYMIFGTNNMDKLNDMRAMLHLLKRTCYLVEKSSSSSDSGMFESNHSVPFKVIRSIRVYPWLRIFTTIKTNPSLPEEMAIGLNRMNLLTAIGCTIINDYYHYVMFVHYSERMVRKLIRFGLYYERTGIFKEVLKITGWNGVFTNRYSSLFGRHLPVTIFLCKCNKIFDCHLEDGCSYLSQILKLIENMFIYEEQVLFRWVTTILHEPPQYCIFEEKKK